MEVPHIIANRFRVECEIGKGGMGTVYRATHLGLERAVAVKILKPEFAADPDVGERFMREARTMARLRHQRAAMIFDAGRLPDGRPFIVMEYVEGQTLADTLARDGRFAPERAVRIACEICDVLAEAHALGIIHRDLKPSNIMLNERGVCVLDFGVAKILTGAATEVTRTHATTESGLIIGTPRYMSPEQCLGQAIGPASDLYSVGVLLYEMLAGQPPFTDQLQSAVLVRQATAPPPPLQAKRPDAPRRLALAAHALLAKSPQDRPESALAARALLEKSIAAFAADVSPSPGARAPVPEIGPFASTLATLDARRTLTASRVISIATTLALCGGLFLVWTRSGTTSAHADVKGTNESGAHTTVVASDTPTRRETANALFTLSPDAARHIAASVNRQGMITDARHVQTPRGPIIIAVQSRRYEGASQLIILELRGAISGGYRVTGNAPLDRESFRGAVWTMETTDADRDGYAEILCTGTDARDDAFTRRLVLYVPTARQSYSVRVGLDGREARAVRVRWSSNAATERAKPYRAVLRERALADLPRAKS